jgi:hypothetical protein
MEGGTKSSLRVIENFEKRGMIVSVGIVSNFFDAVRSCWFGGESLSRYLEKESVKFEDE